MGCVFQSLLGIQDEIRTMSKWTLMRQHQPIEFYTCVCAVWYVWALSYIDNIHIDRETLPSTQIEFTVSICRFTFVIFPFNVIWAGPMPTPNTFTIQFHSIEIHFVWYSTELYNPNLYI